MGGIPSQRSIRRDRYRFLVLTATVPDTVKSFFTGLTKIRLDVAKLTTFDASVGFVDLGSNGKFSQFIPA